MSSVRKSTVSLSWMWLGLLLALVLPTAAFSDTATTGGGVGSWVPVSCGTPGYSGCALGVGYDVQVLDGGAYNVQYSLLSGNSQWALGSSLFPASVPDGSTVNFLTFDYSGPVLGPQTSVGSLLTVAQTSTLDFVSLSEEGCAGDGNLTNVYSGAAAATGSIKFQPCGPLQNLGVVFNFSGSASISATTNPIPTTPGYYSETDIVSESVSYSLTVDYDPPIATPEPGSFMLVLAACCAVPLAISITKSAKFAS